MLLTDEANKTLLLSLLIGYSLKFKQMGIKTGFSKTLQ